MSQRRSTALATVSMSASCIVLSKSASGLVPIVQLTTNPSKQSMMGKRYTSPAGTWNSVTSVSHLRWGPRPGSHG